MGDVPHVSTKRLATRVLAARKKVRRGSHNWRQLMCRMLAVAFFEHDRCVYCHQLALHHAVWFSTDKKSVLIGFGTHEPVPGQIRLQLVNPRMCYRRPNIFNGGRVMYSLRLPSRWHLREWYHGLK